jgi:hypothetical protein
MRAAGAGFTAEAAGAGVTGEGSSVDAMRSPGGEEDKRIKEIKRTLSTVKVDGDGVKRRQLLPPLAPVIGGDGL